MSDLVRQVQELMAELTRYPVDILEPDADLEDDLGIDSVKRGEILLAFGERFGLPQDLNLPPERLSSIAGIAEVIRAVQAGELVSPGAAQPAVATATPQPALAVASAAPAAPLARPAAGNGSGGWSVPAWSSPAPRSGNGAATPTAPATPSPAAPAATSRLAPPPPTPPAPAAPVPQPPAPRAAAAPAGATAPPAAGAPLLETQRWLLRTLIGSLEHTLGQLGEGSPAVPPARPQNGNGRGHGNGNGKGHGSGPELLVHAMAAVAEVTGALPSLLRPEARLTDELGLDPALRRDVIQALARRLGRDPGSLAHLEHATSIAELAEAAGRVAPAAPARVPGALLAAQGAQPFAGKVALVTGSGHGIGRAMAVRLAELGAEVIVNSFHSRERGEETARAIQAAGGKAVHLWGSVAKREHLERLFAEIESRYGALDFFVSNASNGMIAPLEHIQEEHWERAFRTNVIALHQGAMLAAPLMRRRGGGKIVTISSPGAQRVIEHFGCMGPAKAAQESLVRYLGVELGADNIQVNAVSAGPIYGELLTRYPESQRLIPYWESLSARRQLGEESDVAEFVMYLLTESARKITGSVLLVDNGGSQRI